MKILLATNNLGKIREFEFLFNNSDFKLIHLSEFSDKDIPETGNSYEENAFLKAKEAYRITKLPCLLYTSPSPRDGSISRMPSSA